MWRKKFPKARGRPLQRWTRHASKAELYHGTNDVTLIRAAVFVPDKLSGRMSAVIRSTEPADMVGRLVLRQNDSTADVKSTAAPADYSPHRILAAATMHETLQGRKPAVTRRSARAECSGPIGRILAHGERISAGHVRAARQDARRRVVTRR